MFKSIVSRAGRCVKIRNGSFLGSMVRLCQQCGWRFPSSAKLHTHIRAFHPPIAGAQPLNARSTLEIQNMLILLKERGIEPSFAIYELPRPATVSKLPDDVEGAED